jgi:heavy metal sensor kinase
MKFYKSISFKFSSWYLAILGALLLVLGCGVYFSLSKRLHDNLDNTLQERAEQVVRFRNVMGIVAKGTFEEEPGELLSFYYYTGDNELKDLSHKGRRIAVSREWVDNILGGSESDFSFATTPDGKKLRLYSTLYSSQEPTDDDRPAPRIEPSDKIIQVERAVLIIGRTTKNIDLTLNQLLKTLVLVLPLTLFLMGCCGLFFLRIVLRPVQNISDTARDIEAKDLSRRIMVTTQDELGTLAATINHMIERLEKAFLRQKELTGDASHELRAPLTVIQAEATLALQRKREASSYQKSLEIIAKESDHMAAIIGQMLFLARADSGNEMTELTEMDLLPFIQELSADIEPLFQEKQQTLTVHHAGPVVVKADCSLLRAVMLNLLRNAMQYTPDKGEISVSVKKENEMARISVSDNGIGISGDSLPYIFNRFYRVDKARARESGGSGLGLAICKHIVELHQGQISVKSQIDKGTTFSITLPLA